MREFLHSARPSVLKAMLIAVFGMSTLLSPVRAQLSTNPDKFLGNITTSYSVNYDGIEYSSLWNQITCENETKWGSVEGRARGTFSWNDAAYNYAKSHNFPFKFHTLVWGSQYPSWMDNLSTAEQYKAIVEWFDETKKHYPDLAMIDVVNEAIAGHAPAPFKNALGGDGQTGYDWIIKAFEMAYERWPNAILIYNDYNTFQWQKSQFIDLVKTLRDAGAPIDAYGCQSHDLTDMSFTDFKSAMTEIQSALKMPMYSTEYDIGTTDDAKQKTQYSNQIKYMWEQDYCAGITIWGFIYGKTWTNDGKDSNGNTINAGHSGIIKDGKDRPAMTWLRDYMKTDAAKTAKSPFPGMKKEASVYIKPQSLNVEKNTPMTITVRAKMRTKTIDSIAFYVDNKLDTIMAAASSYVVTYTPTSAKTYNLKAVVYTTDGSKYERLSSFKANNPRSNYNGEKKLPGTLQAEDYDNGGEGYTYHDSESENKGDASYRTGNGVDIVAGNGGKAIGYTNTGEWMEYTVNVLQDGYYEYNAYVSSGTTGSGFSISLADNGLTELATISVPQTASNSWNTYKTVTGRLAVPLTAGKHILRITITGTNCNIDKVVFSKINVNDKIRISLSATPNPGIVSTQGTIKATVTPDTVGIKSVVFYRDGQSVKTVTAAPYEYAYTPTSKGTYTFTAVAIDSAGSKSKIASLSYKVNNKRTPYSSAIAIPGTLQAENFDKGGEGVSFHDSDSEDEGGAGYRSDNEGLDIVKLTSGYAIGYTKQNEWMDYTVNVKYTDTYKFTATVSSGIDNTGFSIGLDKNGTVTTLKSVTVPNTGSWDTYKTVTGTFKLSEGQQTLRITITGAYCNIDKIVFTSATAVNYITEDDIDAQGTRYNLGGAAVGNDYKGITIINGKKVIEM